MASHLMPLTAQSNVENRPPQTPKLPPRTGARALIAVIAPIRRSPYGEFLCTYQNMRNWLVKLQDAGQRSYRKPLTPCHIAPPTA